MSKITVDISQRIATITLNDPNSLNSLTPHDYEFFANCLREIDSRDDVSVTVWQATGKWFCAGTNVKTRSPRQSNTTRDHFLSAVTPSTTDCTRALYTHSKILVAALNGPVMGIAAAFLGNFDFIYALPEVWLSVPFSFIGLAVEGGASVGFVNRMGVAKANEMLLWGKKKSAQELLDCGFINQILPIQPPESFHSAVRNLLLKELEGLNPSSLLVIKSLLKAGWNEKNNSDATNLRESYAQAERFATGQPQEQFGRLARKEIRHKL